MEFDTTHVWITTRRLKPGTREEFSKSWIGIDHVAAAADPGALRLDDIQREQRRDRGIDRRSAGAEHLGSRFGSARIGGADHSLGSGRGRLDGTGATAEQRQRGGNGQ